MRLVVAFAGAAAVFEGFFAWQYVRAEGQLGLSSLALLAGVLVQVGVALSLRAAPPALLTERAVRLRGAAVPFGVYGVVAGMAYLDGGLVALPPMYWHAVLPLVAALLAGRRAAFALVALIVAEAALFYALARAGHAFPTALASAERLRIGALSVAGASFFSGLVGAVYTSARERAHEAQRDAFEALRGAKEKAEEASALKTAFMGNVGHEVLSPLTTLTNCTGLLAEAESEAERRELAEIQQMAATRLERTLTAMLDAAQLESGSYQVNLERLDAAAEARRAVRLATLEAEEQGLALRLDVPPGAPAWARLDEDAFARILANLIGNALKFTEEGHVAVSVEAVAGETIAGERVRVRVEDTGPGIDEDFLPHLFESFQRGPRSGDYEGMGLGLSIVHQLTERMGGTLAVDSTAGRGTVFTLTFPAAPAPPGDRPGARPGGSKGVLSVALA